MKIYTNIFTSKFCHSLTHSNFRFCTHSFLNFLLTDIVHFFNDFSIHSSSSSISMVEVTDWLLSNGPATYLSPKAETDIIPLPNLFYLFVFFLDNDEFIARSKKKKKNLLLLTINGYNSYAANYLSRGDDDVRYK